MDCLFTGMQVIADIKATINNVDHLDELVDEVVTSDNYEE